MDIKDFKKINPKMKDVCRVVIKNGGICTTTDCGYCPFYSGNSIKGLRCGKNWKNASALNIVSKAKEFLKMCNRKRNTIEKQNNKNK